MTRLLTSATAFSDVVPGINFVNRIGTLQLTKVDSVATLDFNEREMMRKPSMEEQFRLHQSSSWLKNVVVQNPRKGRVGVSRFSSTKLLEVLQNLTVECKSIRRSEILENIASPSA